MTDSRTFRIGIIVQLDILSILSLRVLARDERFLPLAGPAESVVIYTYHFHYLKNIERYSNPLYRASLE